MGQPRMHTVGQAAQASGLSAKAIRLYERKGLVSPAGRTDAGYRLFSDDDLATLRFIRQAKALGLRLGEIGEILALRHGGASPCHHVLRLLDQRVADIDRMIADLHHLRTTLTGTRRQAADTTHTTDGMVCQIIEHGVPDAENTSSARSTRGSIPTAG